MSIDYVDFSCLSPDKIRSISVCEVTTDELYADGRPKSGGLRDPLFGVSSRRGICSACSQTWTNCSGHFGHYELPHPVYHIGWMSEVLFWLRRICGKCGHVFGKQMSKKCKSCSEPSSKFTKVNATTIRITDKGGMRDLLAPEAMLLLQKASIIDIATLRTDIFHPSWLILTVLTIPPNCVRPSPTMDGDEVRGEDDITRRLLYILRVCKGYRNVQHENSTVIQHYQKKVQDAVHMYIDQTRMSSKNKGTQKCISDRLRGKTGRLRGTLMGKRCNFTARTVISGDAMLDMRDVGIPQEVADKLTIVENVNRLNYTLLREMVSSQDKRIKYVIQKDGTRLDMATVKGQVNIECGCSVERTLKNGDLVLFNRQPSLHRMSIMCHRAKIIKGKTFRLNLSCTTPYNADFDGDEMNLHVLQTHESRADALELMSVAKNIITPQSNKPIMGIVQDSLLSAFMMTSPGVTLDIAEMSNVMMWIEDATELPIPKVQTPEGMRWSGLQCLSMIFPKDFNWKDYVFQGQLLKGPLGKRALGRSHGSIIHRLYNDYGPDRTCQFINELQRTNHIWFSSQGFSIGIGDMRITDKTAEKVRNECANVDHLAEELRKKHKHPESKINRMLNQTRDSMGLIAQSAMSPDNSLGLMVKSGSKGSMVNILQIMACVGQQNCSGKRMQATLRSRTLPMFDFDDNTARSRGFVKHSYVDGLTPDEYWHHTVGGREGLIDTAVKTSTTGYIQRRLVKSLESIHVDNDGTVRDAQKNIIQFKYGEDGLDGMAHEMMTCPFDAMDKLDDHYDIEKWPEVVDAFQMWKWNQPYALGDKWAISVPAQRVLDNFRDGGSLSAAQTRLILRPLLAAVVGLPLVYAYLLAVFTRDDVKCSKKTFTKIINILIHKWYKSIVAPGEMVGTIAAQSVGEPTTQMSASYDTEVMIDINGTVKRVQIGQLIDSILGNTFRESQEMPVSNLKCIGVSPTEDVKWTNITHVSRHPANGTMLNVNTVHNRTLDMTASHSFLVRRNNRIVAMPGHKLVIGDALPIVKNLPKHGSDERQPIELNAIGGHFVGAMLAEGYCNKNSISFCGTDDDWCRTIGQNFADSICLHAYIVRKAPSKHTLGNKKMTTVTFHSQKLAAYFSQNFGNISHTKTMPGWVLSAPDVFVSALLQSYFDGDGNINCTQNHNCIRCHSVSKSLVEMVSLCLARFGIPCYIGSQKYKTPAGIPGLLWEASIPAGFAKKFREHVGFSMDYKKERLYQLCNLTVKKGFQARIPGMTGVLSALRTHMTSTSTRKEINRINSQGITHKMLHTLFTKAQQNNIPENILKELEQAIQADVWWDPIQSIKRYESDALVYDFTVNEKLQSFMLANGVFVHNTLNTFHNAGNSAKNVTLGVPRFEELINASSKMKTPSLTIFTVDDTGLGPEKAWKLKTELQRTRIRDILVGHTYEPETWPGLEAYLECPDNNRWEINPNPKRILHCILSRKKMVQAGLHIHTVINVLRDLPLAKHMIFAHSDNVSGDIQLFAKAKRPKTFFQYVKQILDTTVKGSKYIPAVSIRIDGNQFIIDTEGIDLNHIKHITSMDQKTVQCNDIFAVRKVYGIEAARATLLKEMHHVLSAYGIYVNMRHLMTIVDWMTFAGGITALTRHGVKKRMQSTAPFARATFEQPVEIFHHAAVKGLRDNIKGISEQLLVGIEPSCGSHFNSVVTETAYQKQWDEDDWQPPVEMEEEDLFGEWTGQSVDTQQPPDSTWNSHTTFATTSPMKQTWQQPQAPDWQQPQAPDWQQPQVPAWQQPQVPAWQQSQAPAWQQPQASSPAYSPTASPTSPAYSPTSPAYSPTSPAYSPTVSSTSPAYSPTSPVYSPTASPTSPAYSPTSPAYSPTSPAYSPVGKAVYEMGKDINTSPNKRAKNRV